MGINGKILCLFVIISFCREKWATIYLAPKIYKIYGKTVNKPAFWEKLLPYPTQYNHLGTVGKTKCCNFASVNQTGWLRPRNAEAACCNIPETKALRWTDIINTKFDRRKNYDSVQTFGKHQRRAEQGIRQVLRLPCDYQNHGHPIACQADGSLQHGLPWGRRRPRKPRLNQSKTI